LEVISCLKNAARNAGVHCFTQSAVIQVDDLNNKGFLVYIQGQTPIETKRVLIATGGNSSGRKLATLLGHTIVSPVPSLFSLKLETHALTNCSGVAIDNVKLKLLVGGKSFIESGRILITHWGLSGPAILRLSAFAARELHKTNYKAELRINWINMNHADVSHLLKECRYKLSRNNFANSHPFRKLPRRMWLELLRLSGINSARKWSELSSAEEKKLLKILLIDSCIISSRGPYGEEFVTAGGVQLGEINFSTMESRLSSGLYFAGELLDVDGVTGGFNFQHCWSSGWIAGKAIAQTLKSSTRVDL